MENHFNLIDEPWIPVVDVGLVSLRDVFFREDFRALGGNPVQKIALTKLLLAIAQAACTPQDEDEWQQLGWQGMSSRCLAYLDKWHDRFYLYGDMPFLQMPAIHKAAVQSFGAVQAEIATGNTTVVTQFQIERPLPDADRAVLLITLMGFALGGKKTDNSVVLSPGYAGKANDKGRPSTGKPGPAVAYLGLLHSFCLGQHLQLTLWLNLLSHSHVQDSGIYPAGTGAAPWENMPQGEDCPIAKQLKSSLMGRLLPLCRFCLLAAEGIHYSEGIAHSGYKEGMVDPSAAVNYSGKDAKVLWANPERRPWRELTALLGFIQQQNSGFECFQLRVSTGRARQQQIVFAVWSGGLRVSSNAGEQYASGTDDMVESVLWLSGEDFGSFWFEHLKTEMGGMDSLAKSLYGCTVAYFKNMLMEGEAHAAAACNLFWQLAEHDAQQLIDNCGSGVEACAAREQLRHRFADYAQQMYNRFCPQDTARQLNAWARCRPNFAKYLEQEPA